MPNERLRVLLNACTMPANPTGIWLYGLELGAALAARDDCEVVFASPELYPANTRRLVPPTRLTEERKRDSAAPRERRAPTRRSKARACQGRYAGDRVFAPRADGGYRRGRDRRKPALT